jgi:hypothetical protein
MLPWDVPGLGKQRCWVAVAALQEATVNSNNRKGIRVNRQVHPEISSPSSRVNSPRNNHMHRELPVGGSLVAGMLVTGL